MISWQRRSINQSFQKENNISIVLRALYGNTDCSRVKLAEITGLTQASITKIVSQLIEHGIVSECESVETSVGRKPIRLQLHSEKFFACAIRINRKYINCAIYDMNGKQHAMSRCSISAQDGAGSSVDKMLEMVRSTLSRSKLPVSAIGVAVPGPFNINTGRISLMSGFPGWSEIDIKQILSDAFHLPVYLEQDANCGALAELWFSDIDPDAGLLFVAADRGIGAGLILNGSLYRGKDGYAGEIGHSSINIFGPRCECGNRGCLELYGSTTALENAYRAEVFDPEAPPAQPSDIPARDILELVRQGDPAACKAYRKTVAYLCFGIVGMVNTLNPGTVVFSDKLVVSDELFLRVADQTLKQYLLPKMYDTLRIKICTLHDDPMLLGAAVLVFEEMLQSPLSFV